MPLTTDKVRRIARPFWLRGWSVLAVAALFVAATLGATTIHVEKQNAKPSPVKPAARAKLDANQFALLTEDHRLFLEASPRVGEGLLAFSRRLTGGASAADEIATANGGARELKTGTRYLVPFEKLAAEQQIAVIKALFAKDGADRDGWRHEARGVGPLGRESLWHLAHWFTGDGANFRAIREYNELGDDDIARGAAIVVPAEILRPSFRALLPKVDPVDRLSFGKDSQGEYATYRLRPGEALYSSVVVRFTGRIHGPDVNALAAEIAKRNGIPDVTDIAVGYRIKIPLDVLQPEFLPIDHPRRVAYEAEIREAQRFTNPIRASGLEGITVVLDAGHGGKDAGASMGGVWESLYVYDIALRVKKLLETETAAKVSITTRDGADFRIHDGDVLPFSRGHAVLTTPPYPIEDSVVGVNLRWYLANSVFRRLALTPRDEEKIVFLSIHADSLHPSLRGAMAYIPAASMIEDRFGKSGTAYASFEEVRESPIVNVSREVRTKSEGLSRELAERVIAAFEARALPVHPFKPVRDKVIREGREWVPAVLRYNTVPAKMLLEVCNLANDEDRRRVQTRKYRQTVAEAIVAGLRGYYDESPPPAAAIKIAKSAK